MLKYKLREANKQQCDVRESEMGKKTKAVIGLLVSGITDSFTVSVCRGAMKEAEVPGLPV